MRSSNARIDSFYAQLEERGISKRILWEASRFGNGKTDTFFVAFSGTPAPAICPAPQRPRPPWQSRKNRCM